MANHTYAKARCLSPLSFEQKMIASVLNNHNQIKWFHKSIRLQQAKQQIFINSLCKKDKNG